MGRELNKRCNEKTDIDVQSYGQQDLSGKAYAIDKQALQSAVWSLPYPPVLMLGSAYLWQVSQQANYWFVNRANFYPSTHR